MGQQLVDDGLKAVAIDLGSGKWGLPRISLPWIKDPVSPSR